VLPLDPVSARRCGSARGRWATLAMLHEFGRCSTRYEDGLVEVEAEVPESLSVADGSAE
jgi:hypothetical protein